MNNELAAIKELANGKILDILDALGVSYKERYNYVNACCPVHNGDRKDAWSWQIDIGIWKCFSNDCHNIHGNDIFGLVRGIKDCSFKEALDFVREFVGGAISPHKIKELKDLRDNKAFVYSAKKKQPQKIYPENCLSRIEYHEYLEKRGFSRNIIEKYHIGIGKENHGYMQDRVIFPIRNSDGQIVAFSGRTLHENWKDLGIPKWKHSKDFQLHADRMMYNIDIAKHEIERTSIAIIVEGPLDALKIIEAGILNVVAILGKTLYNGQISELIKAGATKLIIALDNDNPGKTGAEKAMKLASPFFDVFKLDLTGKKDYGEMTAIEVRELFDGIFQNKKFAQTKDLRR
jgi:DNA primase